MSTDQVQEPTKYHGDAEMTKKFNVGLTFKNQ